MAVWRKYRMIEKGGEEDEQLQSLQEPEAETQPLPLHSRFEPSSQRQPGRPADL
jgi:hypothetical protein